MSSFQREQLQQQQFPMMGGATRARDEEPSSGSRTVTIDPPGPSAEPTVGVLQLRGTSNANPERRVIWSQDTIDNEGMGKKKSKICCIYHKPKAFDESSDESSSNSSDASDSESEQSDNSSTASISSNDRARPSKGKEKDHEHSSHDENCKHKKQSQRDRKRKTKSGSSKTITLTETNSESFPPKSNAYERGPV